MELHGTLGPARTSISAIAERAGVRRSTVYRHFPDEAALFGACSSHWAAANPVPDMTRVAGDRRSGRAASHGARRAVRVLPAHRADDGQPAPRRADDAAHRAAHSQPFHEYVAAARDLLMRGRSVRGRRRDEARAADRPRAGVHDLEVADARAGTGRRPGGRADVRDGGGRYALSACCAAGEVQKAMKASTSSRTGPTAERTTCQRRSGRPPRGLIVSRRPSSSSSSTAARD